MATGQQDMEAAGIGHTAAEDNRQRVAQIYVRSESHEPDDSSYTTPEENYNRLDNQFSLAKELAGSNKEIREEPTENSSNITYDSVAQYYRAQLAKDLTTCNKVPNIILEVLASALSIVNIVTAFLAFHQISYEATGIKYQDYVRDDGVNFHSENPKNFGDEVNYHTIHIYREPVFTNWKNFVHLGLSLIVIELAAPILRIVVVINRAPKKINSCHSLVQIGLLGALILEDGAVSLCKNLLFFEECGIRPAMMSPISQISASLCFANSTFKSILFIWRSSYRNQRAVRDEMEAYTEILILEEYQWYHCIIPILTHIAVICLSAWSLIEATSPVLICTT